MSLQVKERASASGPVKVTAKKHRWYLGGFASALAACCTHPLDLLKVRPSLDTIARRGNCICFRFRQFLLCIELNLVWVKKVWISFKRENIAFIVRVVFQVN